MISHRSSQSRSSSLSSLDRELFSFSPPKGQQYSSSPLPVNRRPSLFSITQHDLTDDIKLLRDQTNSVATPISSQQQYRIVSNPFDPPSSVHLKQRLASPSIFQLENNQNQNTLKENRSFEWSVERRAVLNPANLSEHVLQIDAHLFNENLQERYQKAAGEFCEKLHLPTPAAAQPQQQPNYERHSWYNGRSNDSSSLVDVRSTTPLHSQQRDMGCQTRLSLPPKVDIESIIQSFCSSNNTSGTNDSTRSSQLNDSQIRRKLFHDDEENDNDEQIEQKDSSILSNHSFNNNNSIQQPDESRSSIKYRVKNNNWLHSQKDYRSSSPFRNVQKLLTPDCSPIQQKQSNKTNQNRKLQMNENKQSQQQPPSKTAFFLSPTGLPTEEDKPLTVAPFLTLQSIALIRSITRPTRYNHFSVLTNSPMTMSFGSPPISSHSLKEDSLLIRNGQTPSQYARQVLDSALQDLMECSM